MVMTPSPPQAVVTVEMTPPQAGCYRRDDPSPPLQAGCYRGGDPLLPTGGCYRGDDPPPPRQVVTVEMTPSPPPPGGLLPW